MGEFDFKNLKYYENFGPNDVSGAAREYLDDFIRWCMKDKAGEKENLRTMLTVAGRSLLKKRKITRTITRSRTRERESLELQDLTNRQNEIISLIKNFNSQKEVAEILNISLNTLKVHLQVIYPAFKSQNYFELVSKLNGFDKCEVPTIGILTKMENKVFKKMIKGYERKQIAEALIAEQSTIATHQCRLYKKLHVHNVVELLKWFNNYRQKLKGFSENKEVQEMINSVLGEPTPVHHEKEEKEEKGSMAKVMEMLSNKQKTILVLLQDGCSKLEIMNTLKINKKSLDVYLTGIYRAMSTLIEWKHGSKISQIYRYFGYDPKVIQLESQDKKIEVCDRDETKNIDTITMPEEKTTDISISDFKEQEPAKENDAYRITCNLLKKEIEGLINQKGELETRLADVKERLSALEYAETFISSSIF